MSSYRSSWFIELVELVFLLLFVLVGVFLIFGIYFSFLLFIFFIFNFFLFFCLDFKIFLLFFYLNLSFINCFIFCFFLFIIFFFIVFFLFIFFFKIFLIFLLYYIIFILLVQNVLTVAFNQHVEVNLRLIGFEITNWYYFQVEGWKSIPIKEPPDFFLPMRNWQHNSSFLQNSETLLHDPHHSSREVFIAKQAIKSIFINNCPERFILKRQRLSDIMNLIGDAFFTIFVFMLDNLLRKVQASHWLMMQGHQFLSKVGRPAS